MNNLESLFTKLQWIVFVWLLYSAVKKYFAPFWFLSFLQFYISHTSIFQSIKQVLISEKDNLGKYKL